MSLRESTMSMQAAIAACDVDGLCACGLIKGHMGWLCCAEALVRGAPVSSPAASESPLIRLVRGEITTEQYVAGLRERAAADTAALRSLSSADQVAAEVEAPTTNHTENP